MKTMLRQWLLVLAVACAGPMAAAVAQDAKPARTMPDAVKNALASVVGIKATVPRAARSAETLGVERIGHGVAIDADGLVLTVGYLILEADAVEVTEAGGRKISAAVVAYDYDSGFGLVRTAIPLRARPLPLGESDALKVESQATVAGYGGPDAAQRVIVADRRDFAGYWEYVLDRAIFTAPPYPLWGGAALIGDDGALLGIGSLQVGDAYRGARTVPGNMFIPIDRLKTILADLKEGRRPETPKPWLGMRTYEAQGRLVVADVTKGGPAEQAGVRRGDVVRGVGESRPETLLDFYRKLWATGPSGTTVTLGIERNGERRDIAIPSGDRYKYLRLDTSL